MFRVYCECAKTSIGYAAIMSDKTVVKVLPYVMRSVNELNIPPGNTQGYEILYFGVNLILMFDYRLSYNIELLRLSCPFITNW
jgi:hypothetical protein